MRIRINVPGNNARHFEETVEIPREILQGFNPDSIAEYIARQFADRWAIAKGFNPKDAKVTSYYVGMLAWLRPRVLDILIKRAQASIAGRSLEVEE